MPYIAELLFRQKSCELPGIGSFTITYIPATTNQDGAQFHPPGEQIQFEEITEGGIARLVHYLAQKINLPEPKVNAEMEKAILRLKLHLAEGEVVRLPQIGSMSRNLEGKIDFSPRQDLLPIWLPLEALPLAPRQDVPPPSPPTSPQDLEALSETYDPKPPVTGIRWWWLASGFIFLLLVGMVLCLRECALGPQNRSGVNRLTPSPTRKSPLVAMDTEPRSLAAVDSVKIIPVAKDSISYNIVFAGFSDRAKAEKKYLKIKHWGHPVTLFKDSTGSYLLAVPFFTPAEDSEAKLHEVREIYGKTSYIRR